MTRLYDPFGSFKCSLCHKHPNLGWLYRCTQDSHGFLPESDFTDQPPQVEKRTAHHISTYSLSSPIIKAIGDGHYTDEQIKSLIQQKEKVKDLVLEQDSRPATSSTSTTTSCSTDETFSTLPQSTTFSTTSSTSLDEEIRAAYDWKELQKVWMSEPSIPLSKSPLKLLPPRERHFDSVSVVPQPPCTFKICPTCRPTYRERAYQSLEAILNNPTHLPPIWELENRRVSDARIVARIGLPKAPRFYAQEGHSALHSMHTIPEITVDHVDEDNAEHADDTHSVRKRSGFRQTVRKALARARLEDGSSVPQRNDTDTGDNADLDTSRHSRSLIFRRRSRPTLSFVESHGRLVDTSGLQESVMLMVASNTPLPHTPIESSHQPARLEYQSTEQEDLDGTGFQAVDLITQA
jgi:hypothetical protein